MTPYPHSAPDSRDEKPAPPRRKRFRGCLVTSALAICAVVIFCLWFRGGLIVKWIVREGKRLEQRPAPDADAVLASLRQRVGEIQAMWEKSSDSAKLRGRLETLHKDLVARRNSATKSAGKYWEDLIAKSEALIEKSRKKSAEIPRELDELRTVMQSLEHLTGGGKSGEGPSPSPNAEDATGKPVSPQGKPTPGPQARSGLKAGSGRQTRPASKPSPAVPPPDYQIGP